MLVWEYLLVTYISVKISVWSKVNRYDVYLQQHHSGGKVDSICLLEIRNVQIKVLFCVAKIPLKTIDKPVIT